MPFQRVRFRIQIKRTCLQRLLLSDLSFKLLQVFLYFLRRPQREALPVERHRLGQFVLSQQLEALFPPFVCPGLLLRVFNLPG